MRYWILASALVASSAIAAEATPGWQFYQDPAATNGLLQAFVQASDGTQLILKCDKAGKGSVYAVLVSTQRVANPRARFTMRPISVRYDGGEVNDERWRYFDNLVTAVNRPGEASLTRLLDKLAGAKLLEVRIDPEGRQNPDYTAFDVHGAGEAIDKVYASCMDTRPTA